MAATTPPVIRQMEALLQEKLIPWIQDGAPQIFFNTPPRALFPMEFKEESKAPLPFLHQPVKYPHVQAWPSENLNSIDAPVLGCVFAGQTDYHVRRPPGEAGQQWIIPVPENTFFIIPPGIPFTRGLSDSGGEYARAILIHSRRDCMSCFTYTIDHGKVWQNPYVLLHEFDAQLLVWRLLEEWQKPSLSHRIIYYYTSLIFDLMLRAFQEKRFTDVHGITTMPELQQTIPLARHHHSDIVEFAKTYIAAHLENPDLSSKEIALHAGVSVRHLERLFNEHTDTSPAAFLHEQRLAKAKVLLQGSTLSIAGVAYYCGFRQTSHFSRWFKQKTHCPPREFRKQHNQLSRKDN